MRRRRLSGLYVPSKEIHKSLRMTEQVYDYIMQLDGETFSQKFERLVADHARLTGCAGIRW